MWVVRAEQDVIRTHDVDTHLQRVLRIDHGVHIDAAQVVSGLVQGARGTRWNVLMADVKPTCKVRQRTTTVAGYDFKISKSRKVSPRRPLPRASTARSDIHPAVAVLA